MSRSIWKGPFNDITISTKPQSKGVIKCSNNSAHDRIWSRRSCILPHFVGKTVHIYNGRSFIILQITEEMVGHKFGEFASTRRVKQTHKHGTKSQSNRS